MTPTRLYLTATLTLLAALAQRTHAQTTPAPLQLNNTPVELRLGFVTDSVARLQVLPLNPQGQPIESPDGPLMLPQKWLAEPLKIRTAQSANQTGKDNRLLFDRVDPGIAIPGLGPWVGVDLESIGGRVSGRPRGAGGG